MAEADGFSITHGGVLEVDTEVVRDIAARLGAVARLVQEAADAAHQAHRWIVAGAGLSVHIDTVALWGSGDALTALRAEFDRIVEGATLMADAYELVELRAQRDALALTDGRAADAVSAEIAEIEAADERLATVADYLTAGWEERRFEGLDSQFDLLGLTGLAPGAVVAAVTAVSTTGLVGTVPPGFVVTGKADPVVVRPVQTSAPVAPPASLADAFRRFPETENAQVKVERYTFADGATRYVLYAKGTQSGLAGGEEPWDMRSNAQMYLGMDAASYRATVEALHQAGAGPGDRVDVYAHSQAGMIGSYLATQGEFDVDLLVTAGSPVEPMLGEDQLLIQLRHSDDLVNALAGGGSPQGSGSADSFVAQREGDPPSQWRDVILEPHMIDTYIETAELVDDSGDPRVEAYRVRLAELARAEHIEATEYEADRTGWAQ
ncbi:hypothetical protein ACWGJP_05395 [Microbacterium sp. NPDC055903]